MSSVLYTLLCCDVEKKTHLHLHLQHRSFPKYKVLSLHALTHNYKQWEQSYRIQVQCQVSLNKESKEIQGKDGGWKSEGRLYIHTHTHTHTHTHMVLRHLRSHFISHMVRVFLILFLCLVCSPLAFSPSLSLSPSFCGFQVQMNPHSEDYG